MTKNIAILGAGGYCTVIINLINLNLYNIVGIYDDKKEFFLGHRILGKIDELDSNIENFVIGIGNDKVRKTIYNKFKNLNWCTLIHPSCIIAQNVNIGKGSVICAGSVIQPYVDIGKQCIINTNCNIDHESVINDFSSICPGVTICGQVKIGKLCFIGANSTIINNINIEDNSIVGAGSVIIRNVAKNSKIVGNPGKPIR
jgi:acetyltransferase EpsM